MSYSTIYPTISGILDRNVKRLQPHTVVNKGVPFLAKDYHNVDTWEDVRHIMKRDVIARTAIQIKYDRALWLKSYHMLPQHFWCKAEAILCDSDIRIVSDTRVRLGIDFMCEDIDVSAINNTLAKYLLTRALNHRRRADAIKRRSINALN